jgi:hypothetical protein
MWGLQIYAKKSKKGPAAQFSLGKRRQQDYALQLAARDVCEKVPRAARKFAFGAIKKTVLQRIQISVVRGGLCG